jgi:hypothetical protein
VTSRPGAAVVVVAGTASEFQRLVGSSPLGYQSLVSWTWATKHERMVLAEIVEIGEERRALAWERCLSLIVLPDGVCS